MDWIDQLEEDAWNVVIDELVWHLREDRLPILIHRQFSPIRGVEFRFQKVPTAFFPVEDHFLEDHWDEAVEIIARFPQLRATSIRSGA